MTLERAVLVRLATMTHQHAVARAAVAHLVLRAGDDKEAAAAHAASASAAPNRCHPPPQPLAPPPHYHRVLAELPTHPRVLVCADADDEDEAEVGVAGDEALAAATNTTTTTTTTAAPAPTTPPPSSSLAAAVLRFHSEAREAQARARLRALRANDVGAYLALLKGAREGRLRECFAQSEAVMAQVLARLPATATAGDDGAAGAANNDDDDDDEAPAGAKAQAAWERLSARIRAAGSAGGSGGQEQQQQQQQLQQPAMLGGGGGGGGQSGEGGDNNTANPPPPPSSLRLRSYQLEGMRWMVGLKRLGLNGILADEMGLGKTVQVLAAVCHDLESYSQAMGAWAAGRRAAAAAAASGNPPPTHLPPRPPPRRPALILCPASVLPNWAAETRRWAPGLRLLAYTGPAAQRDLLWESAAFEGGGSGSSRSSRPAFDVLLVSYETLMSKRDFPRLSSLGYGWLVVDEGHRVKNADCRLATLLRQVRASCRLLLTGTPLQMDLRELWSLLDFLMPGAFGSSSDFDEYFSAPIRALREAAGETAANAARAGTGAGPGGATAAAAGQQQQTTDEAALLSEEEYLLVASRLHRVLRPFVLRRVKENVAGELPKKEEHLLSCGASPYEAALCALVRLAAASAGAASSVGLLAPAAAGSADAAAASEASSSSASSSFAEAALAALRDSGVPPPPASELRAYNNPVMELRGISNHPLLSRLHAWGAAGGGSGAEDDDGEGGADDNPRHHHAPPPLVRLSGKFEVLDRLLARLSAPPVPQTPNQDGADARTPASDPHAHRVLIFSTMTRALDMAAALLERRGLSYLRLDGGTATDKRGDLAAQFAAAGASAPSSAAGGSSAVGASSSASAPPPPPFAFLLSVRAGGVGLNLQAADSVVMLDSDPNPQADLQAQARAHRLGQTREVRVYRLASRADACEAHVARRCDERRRFAAAAIDAGLFDGRGGNESEMERRGVLMEVLRQPAAAVVPVVGAAPAGGGAQAAAAAAAAPSSLGLLGGGEGGDAQAPPPTALAVIEAVAAHAARAAEAAERDPNAAASPTDDELNVMVARSPEELAALRRRFAASAAASAAAASVASAIGQPPPLRGGRLATAAECARLIRRACEASLRPRKREEDLSRYGRGMRRALQDSAQQGPPLPPRPGSKKRKSKQEAPAAATAAAAVEAGAVELLKPAEDGEVVAMEVEEKKDEEDDGGEGRGAEAEAAAKKQRP